MCDLAWRRESCDCAVLNAAVNDDAKGDKKLLCCQAQIWLTACDGRASSFGGLVASGGADVAWRCWGLQRERYVNQSMMCTSSEHHAPCTLHATHATDAGSQRLGSGAARNERSCPSSPSKCLPSPIARPHQTHTPKLKQRHKHNKRQKQQVQPHTQQSLCRLAVGLCSSSQTHLVLLQQSTQGTARFREWLCASGLCASISFCSEAVLLGPAVLCQTRRWVHSGMLGRVCAACACGCVR